MISHVDLKGISWPSWFGVMLLIKDLLSKEEIILKFGEIYEFEFVFGHEFIVIPEIAEFLEDNICRFFLVVFSNNLSVFKCEGVVGC